MSRREEGGDGLEDGLSHPALPPSNFLSEDTNVLFLADAKKKTSERKFSCRRRSAVEKETGIRFPVILDTGKNDKGSNLRLISGDGSLFPLHVCDDLVAEQLDVFQEDLGGRCERNRSWKKINEYAVGLYVDATAAKGVKIVLCLACEFAG
eukprot:561165-Hanusia_phi.AAC.6